MNERDVFAIALQKPSDAERSSYLDDACGDDLQLRARIQKLLQAERQLGSFLECPPAADATADLPRAGLKPGTLIGAYRILKQLGEGGFGIVYMAEQQQPVRRKVALKIVKPGMDTKELIARFEAERQALAMMDHQHIAKVLDCGATEKGVPYFVMELVSGEPITEFCDHNKLNARERLELFVLVCRAVQHAHYKGIIHRDIKPSNILVARHDGKPLPKIIDFGISKAIGRRLTDQSIYTEFGRVVGTPLYMSPEQAGMGGADVDTRTDIYSLGVVLYELLTGVTPLAKDQLARITYDEMRRIIRDEDPIKPSTRVSAQGDTATSVSALRSTDPKRLTALLRHDLDWVVMKALEKDCDRRYPTAAEFAEDVQRYLDDEPVEACPPSAAYRFRKFARRHRGALMTAAALIVMLVAGTAVSAWQSVRAGRSERAAKAEAAASEAVIAFINRDILGQSDPYQQPDRNLKVREALDRAADKLKGRFAEQPLVEAAIRHAVGTSYLALGETHKAEQHLSRAVELQRKLRGEDHPKAIASRVHLAVAICDLGRAAEAEKLHRQVLAVQNIEPGKDHPRTLATRMNLIAAIHSQGRYAEALQETAKLLEVQRLAIGEEHPNTLKSMANLAILERTLGNQAEAERICRELLPVQRRALRPDHPDTLNSMSVLANAVMAQGRYEEAVTLHQQLRELRARVLGDEHPATLASWNNLALATLKAGRQQEAEQLRRDLLEVQLRLRGAEHPTTLRSQMNLANVMQAQGEHQEAEKLHAQVAAARRRVLGDEHPETLSSELNLVNAIYAQRRYAEAEQRYRKLLEIQRRVAGEEHVNTVSVMLNLSNAIHNQGKDRLAEAESLRRKVLDIQTRVLGPKHPDTLATMFNLANTLNARGQREQAGLLYREVLPKLQRELGDKHPITLKSMMALSQFTADDGRHLEAELLFRQVLASQREVLGDAHPDTIHSINALAWFLAFAAPEEHRNPPEAIQLANEVLRHAPNNRKGQKALSQAQYRAGQLEQARETLERSLNERGSNRHDLLTLALVQWHSGERQEAAAILSMLGSQEMTRRCDLQLRNELEALLRK